jgi:hypothetical protein
VRGLDGGGGVADRVFRLLLGNSQATFLANMSGLPGPMQLLPSEHFPADGAGRAWNSFLGHGGLAHAALYGGANSPPGLAPAALGLAPAVLAELRARAAEVAAFHAFLGPPVPGGGPDTWLVYGTGRRTEVRVEFGGSVAPALEDRGDEVVPELSATALGLPPDRMIPVRGLAHADACENAAVRDLVADILAGRPVAPAVAVAFALPEAPGGAPEGGSARAGRPGVPADAGVEEWFRAARGVAAKLGARVRIVVDVDPPAGDGNPADP